jgi:predicted nuclease with TOPRIM domain
MGLTIHVHVHHPEIGDDLRCQLDRIERKVDLMAQNIAELEAELVSINEATTRMADSLAEIDSDIDELLAREPNLPTSVTDLLNSIKSNHADLETNLQTTAAKYPPVQP